MHTSVFFSQTPAGQQTPNTLLGRFSATDSPTSSPRPPLYPSGPPSPRTALRRRRLLVPPINHLPSFATCSPPTPRPRRVVRLHDSDGSSGGGSRALGALGGGGGGGGNRLTCRRREREVIVRAVGGWGARLNAEVGARGGDFGGSSLERRTRASRSAEHGRGVWDPMPSTVALPSYRARGGGATTGVGATWDP